MVWEGEDSKKKKWAGGVAQVVECLAIKCKALTEFKSQYCQEKKKIV
jgi:hypothetical protein